MYEMLLVDIGFYWSYSLLFLFVVLFCIIFIVYVVCCVEFCVNVVILMCFKVLKIGKWIFLE